MTQMTQTWLVRILIVGVVAGAAYLLWRIMRADGPPDGFAVGNGRIEPQLHMAIRLPWSC